MKKFYLLILLVTGSFLINASAQNVFDVNDRDSIFTPTNQPPAPGWGRIAKWGHTVRLTNWGGTGTTSFKSYFFDGMPFRLKFPKSYQQGVNDGKVYPVYVFFHGEGEAGKIWDNEFQMFWGGRRFRDAVDNGTFDGFLFYNQTSNGYEDHYFAQVAGILDSLAKYCKADRYHVILNGLSSGSQGQYPFMAAYPAYVAVSPIISAARAEDIPIIPSYVHIPMWLFHGGLDNNPTIDEATQLINAIRNGGGYIKETLYPTLGHGVWNNSWDDPGWLPFVMAGYKSNPLCFFQKTNFCSNQPINARLGVSTGFYAYQWMKDGVVIPGATSNEITATQLGTYSARVQISATSRWSDWSHTPVVLTSISSSSTPPITVNGLRSIVLPAPDSSVTVPLMEAAGAISYKWVRTSDSAVVGTQNIYNAPPGTYVVSATTGGACSASYSPPFTVLNANGPNGPDPATNLSVTTASQTSIQLVWSKNPHPNISETGFEIYRGTRSGGPYTLIKINPKDSITYLDNGLLSNTTYYYVVRAVNNNAGSQITNEGSAKTSSDTTPPTAPSNLTVTNTSRNSVTLSWTASTDNVGVAYYDIYVNGQKSYTTAILSPTVYTVQNLTADQTYNFQLKARDAAGNISPFSNQVTATAAFSGLSYAYYQGAWANLPNFNTLTPVKTGFTPNVSLSPATQTTNFGFIWQGYLNIRVAGTYTLETSSDDGSALWLGSLGSTTSAYNPGGTPLINNDGTHAQQSRTATIALSVGFYPIAITYFQAGGGFAMQLFWSASGIGISRSQIPDSAFTETVTLGGAAPAAPSNLVATGVAYNKINLSWTDNSTNATGFEIYRSTSSNGTYNTIFTTPQGQVTYTDSNVAANTTYYYKVKAIGQFGQSAFNVTVASATTLPLPAPPIAPSGLSATALSSSAIRIVWNDANNDANSFQISRATGGNSNYRVIATITNTGGTAFNYTDSSLFDNVLYYFMVNGVNAGGPGAFSNFASALTPLNNPVITAIPNFTMRYGTNDTVAIAVTDKDAVPISISNVNLPAFATLTDNGNGTGRIIFSPATSDAGTYNGLVIRATASNGGMSTDTFNLVVNNNYLPVLNAIPNASFNEGTKDTILISATDQDGVSDLVFSSSNLPSFATLQNNGNGTASIFLKPTFISHGTYTVPIKVTDAQGGVGNRSFVLTIIKKNPNRQYLVRTKNQYTVAFPWNNMTGAVLNNLVAADGSSSNISISFSTPNWWNTYNQGPTTGNNSGVYPDSVEKEYYYFGIYGGPTTVNDTISGLQPNTKYNFKFYGGSASNLVANNGTTVYSIGSQSVPLNVQNNTANTANFYGIAADPSGRVIVTMSMANDGITPAGFVNAFEIDFLFDDSTAPAKPTNLAAKLVQGKGVQLTWTDFAYNAQQYQVWRATDTTQPFTLLDPTNNNPNLASYVDSTVSGRTTYYYKLKAVNQYGDLGFTNTVSITTTIKNPTVTGIDNVTVKINSPITINFTATGDPGVAVTVADTLPSFATLQNLGSGNYRITLAPTSSSLGAYKASVTATDSYGAVTTVPFQIFVVESNVASVLVHFGTDTAVAPAPWNNFLGYPFATKSLTNMQRTDGTNSGISVTLLDQWSNPPVEMGMITGDNSGLFPDVVSRSSYYESSNNTKRIKLSGLDASKLYNVVIFSSVNSGQTSSSTYSIGGQSIDFSASFNTNKTAQFNGLTPDGTGSLILSYTKDPKTPFGYFNALVIQAYDPAVVPIVSPNFVYAEPVFNSRTALRVYWADRSNNETAIEVWRGTALNGPFALVQSLPAGRTSFLDQGLSPNTQYFYEIRAVNGSAQSDFSIVATAITPATIVLEHFTATMKEGIKPWNNTGVSPQVGDRYGNLIDDQLHNTGMAISVLGSFGGEYNGGMSSGNNSYVFPDTVMLSNFWVQLASQTALLKIDGLDQSKKYRIGFEGSANLQMDLTGYYTIGNVTKYLNADSNTSKVIYFDGVVPNMNGEINLAFGAKGQYGLLGAMVIMGYTDNGLYGPVNNPHPDSVNNIVNTVQTAEAAIANEFQGFKAYPNPFREGFTITYNNLTSGKKIDIEVYSLEGRLIYAQEGGYSATGVNTHNVYLPATTAPGMYLARIKTDGKVSKVFKLIKMR